MFMTPLHSPRDGGIVKTMAGLAGHELELRLLSEARGTKACVTDVCTSAPSNLDAQCDMPTSPNLAAGGNKKWTRYGTFITPGLPVSTR